MLGAASGRAWQTGLVIISLQTSARQSPGVLSPADSVVSSWVELEFPACAHAQVRCYGVLRADFAVPARWKPNSTPLHIAAARGSTSMVKHMLQSFVRRSLRPSSFMHFLHPLSATQAACNDQSTIHAGPAKLGCMPGHLASPAVSHSPKLHQPQSTCLFGLQQELLQMPDFTRGGSIDRHSQHNLHTSSWLQLKDDTCFELSLIRPFLEFQASI